MRKRDIGYYCGKSNEHYSSYDVVFNEKIDVILQRFGEHFPDTRVLFGAEPFCWPDENLAPDYPLIEFGKRYLNSGMFMGYAPEIYKILTVNEVGDKDDDQLYYTMIYLDQKLRVCVKLLCIVKLVVLFLEGL